MKLLIANITSIIATCLAAWLAFNGIALWWLFLVIAALCAHAYYEPEK